jgi:hypothetical protein
VEFVLGGAQFGGQGTIYQRLGLRRRERRRRLTLSGDGGQDGGQDDAWEQKEDGLKIAHMD